MMLFQYPNVRLLSGKKLDMEEKLQMRDFPAYDGYI